VSRRPVCRHCKKPLSGDYGGRGEFAYIKCGCEGQVIEEAKKMGHVLWSAFYFDQKEYSPCYPNIVGGHRVRDMFRYLVGPLHDDIDWSRVFEAVYGKPNGMLR
jgi:hypothetical protein